MHLRNKAAFALLFIIGLLPAVSGWALDLSTGSDEPIKIAADRAELNDKTGQSVYTGNVIITQGRSKLEADSVTVNSDDSGITGFIAAGELVHLVQYDKDKDVETHAYAVTISFNRDNNEIVLRKKAKLVQENSSFQGEEIRYNTVKRIVTAESDSANPSEGRVEIIYQPNKGD